VSILADENDGLRDELNQMGMTHQNSGGLLQENENLRELLHQLRNKLEIQLQTYTNVWERSRNELELKHKLAEDINIRIEGI